MKNRNRYELNDHLEWVKSLKKGDVVLCVYKPLVNGAYYPPIGVTSFIAADFDQPCQSGCRVWVKDCDVLLDANWIEKPLLPEV